MGFGTRFQDEVGPLFGGEVLYSEDCPNTPIGSPDLWFDAMAPLAHATNDSGAFRTNIDTIHVLYKKK